MDKTIKPISARVVPRRARRLTQVLQHAGKFSLFALWTSFLRQSPSYWFATLYLFVEYVRPQQIYTSLAVFPWGNFALGGAALLTLLEGRLSFRETLIWVLVGAFTLIIFVSTAAAGFPYAALHGESGWSMWVSWLLAMSVIAGMSKNRPQIILLFAFWILWNLKMSQSGVRSWAAAGFAFQDWGMAGAPGWFTNSGEFGAEMVVFFPITLYFMIGLWPSLSRTKRLSLLAVAASAVLGMVGSASRGAVLGGVAIGLWILFANPHRVRNLLLLGSLAVLGYLMLPQGSKDRWSTAGTDKTSTLRITYWKRGVQLTKENPVLGVGFQNWIPAYKARFQERGQEPHNVFIKASAELGVVGLVVFLGLIGATLHQNVMTRRHSNPKGPRPDRFAYFMAFGLDSAMIGYLAAGFFVTILYYPYFWVNLGFTLALWRYATSADSMRRNRAMTRRPA